MKASGTTLRVLLACAVVLVLFGLVAALFVDGDDDDDEAADGATTTTEDTTTIPPEQRSADLTLSRNPLSPPVFRFSIQNAGPHAASGVELLISVGPGMSATSATTLCSPRPEDQRGRRNRPTPAGREWRGPVI